MNKKVLNHSGEIVKMSNALARGRWLPKSIYEPRLIAQVAARIHKDDQEFKTYEIPVTAILQGKVDGRTYKILADAADNLMGKVITVDTDNKRGWIKYTIFSYCEYDAKNGCIRARFDPDLKPHYLNLKSNFAKYNLNEYMNLPSSYSQRIFEILKSWDDKPEVIIPLAELYEMLKTPSSQKKTFGEFRRRVLEKAYKDIHKHTSLRFEWESIKTGRKVTAIRFVFSKPRKNEILESKQGIQEQKEQKKSSKQHQAALAAINCYKQGNCIPNKSLRCTICKRLFNFE